MQQATHGRGHIDNHPSRRPPSILHHPTIGAILRIGGAIEPRSLAPFAPPVWDQGPLGSCEAHAEAGALGTTLAASGNPLGFVASPDLIYKVTRCLMRVSDGDSPSTPLTDSGSEPAFATRAVAEWGIVPQTIMQTSDGRYDDIEQAGVNDEPSFASLMSAATRLARGAHAIDLVGQDRYNAIRAAISSGRAIKIALNADGDAWQGYTGGTLGAQTGGSDHAVYLLSWKNDDAGKLVVGGRNSWGATGWGVLGDFFGDESFVNSLTDLEVVDATTIVVGGAS